MPRHLRALFCALAIGFGLVSAQASAQTVVPVVKLATAPLVTPATAWGAYSTSTTHTNGAAAFTATPPEISALARSLGAERLSLGQITTDQFVANVYDYVRNNIETEFRFGLAKGGRGALIDESGTPFDTAELMVKLLRAGGITANYQVGTIQLTGQEFGLWSGFISSFTPSGTPGVPPTVVVNAQAACQFLADGGIPATVNGANSCVGLTGNLSAVTLAHIWVQANSKLYDPSFKRHIFKASIDIAAAMGCGTVSSPTCGSQATTTAMTGATQSTFGPASVASIQNANETGLETQLTTFATSLQHTIETNKPAAQLDDVVGGKEVDTSYKPVGGTALPYATPTPVGTPITWTGDVPDPFRTTLNVQAGGINTTLYSDEISTRRVRIFEDATTAGAYTLELTADDIFVQTVSCTTFCGAGSAQVTLTVAHPYSALSGAYASDTIVSSGAALSQATAPLTIIQAWGETNPSTQKYIADLQIADPSPFKGVGGADHVCNAATLGASGTGTIPEGVPCRADDQPTAVAMYLVQRSLANRLIGSMLGAPVTTHHVLGVLYYSQDSTSGSHLLPPTLDVRASVSTDSVANAAPQSAAAFEVSTIFAATLEGSVGQQTMNSVEPMSGPSMLALANRNGIALLDVPATSMANTVGSLSNYVPTRLTALQNAASNNYEMIIPQSGTIPSLFPSYFPGIGNLLYGGDLALASGQIGYLVSESWKGGGAPQDPDPAGAVLKAVKYADVGTRKKSYASVSLSTGGLTFTAPPDLVTGAGDFPLSLPFQRTYQSDGGSYESVSEGPLVPKQSYQGPDQSAYAYLGGGWTHNYQITARIGSDGPRALGRVSGVDAAGSIAGIETLYNLLTAPNFSQRVTSILTSYWLGRQFVDNTVTVSRSPSEEVFSLLPSGRFNPPPGSADVLAEPGAGKKTLTSFSIYSGYAYQGLIYDYSPIAIQFTDRAGSVISFSSASKTGYLPYPLTGGAVTPVYVGNKDFKADTWKFPTGLTLNFTYGVIGNNAYQTAGPAAAGVTSNLYYLTSVSNSLGRQLNFNSVNTYAYGSPWIQSFGLKLTSVSDETGRQATFALSNCPEIYDNNGAGTDSGLTYAFACQKFSVTAPDGGVTTYDYTPGADSPDPGWITKPNYRLRRWFTSTNATKPFQVFAYDDAYRAKTATDILGHQTRYYAGGLADEWLKHAEASDPMGNVTDSWFDQWNDNTQSIDAVGLVTTETYDSGHRLTLTVNPDGASTAATYDLRSNVLTQTHYPKPGSPLTPIVTSATYPEPTAIVCASPITCNEPLSETDARNAVSIYTWDPATGLPTKILKPADMNGLQPEVDLAYSLVGPSGGQFSLLSQKTDKISATQSLVTNFNYAPSTGKYLLSSVTVDPAGLNLTTSFTFDALGNVTAVDGPRMDVNDVSNYTWDANRRLTMAISPDPDGAGSLPRPATRYRYDTDGELLGLDKGTTTTATGSDFSALETTTYAYDATGNKIQTTTPAGVTQASYDADDRPLCTAVRMNPAVYGSLPDACALSTVAGGVYDRITQLTYDADGRKLVETRAYGAPKHIPYATYSYVSPALGTAQSALQTITDANTNKTTYLYDGFDRLAQTQYPSTTLSAGTSDPANYEAYAYDPNGNKVAFRKRDGNWLSYCYDALNRPVEKYLRLVTCPALPGALPTPTGSEVTTNYDLMNRVLSVHYATTLGANVDYGYDLSGRLMTETTNSQTMTYAYNEAGDRTRVTWPDGFYAAYAYDAMDRLTQVAENGATSGVGVLATFSYDPLGRQTGVARAGGAGASTATSYDTADRPTNLSHSMPGATDFNVAWTFGYNPASQILSRAASTTVYDFGAYSPGTINKAPDGLNRDAGIAALGTSPCSPSGSGYDCNGNETNDGARTFTYDLENRLTGGTVTTTSTTVTLAYDPLGRLHGQTTTVAAGSPTVTQFLYDGDRLSAEYDGSGNLLRRYVHGTGTDEPLVWYEGGNGSTDRRWLHSDNQGSVIAYSSATGVVSSATTYSYGTYGEPNVWAGSRFRYTGQIVIPELMVYDYKARAYDPLSGRFLQTDPVGYKSDLDAYTYVADDPSDRIDPTGMDSCGFLSCVGGPGILGGQFSGAQGPLGSRSDLTISPGAFEVGTRSFGPKLQKANWLTNWYLLFGPNRRLLENEGIRTTALTTDRYNHIIDEHGAGAPTQKGKFFPQFIVNQDVLFSTIIIPALESSPISINANKNTVLNGVIIHATMPFPVGWTGTLLGPSVPTYRVDIVLVPGGGGLYYVWTAFPVR